MARPRKHPVDVELKIVLSVRSGEATQAEAARRHGIARFIASCPELTHTA